MFFFNPLWNPLPNESIFLKSTNLVQKASHDKNRISARFCLKSTELGKPSKSRPFDPACNSVLCGSNSSSGTLFGPFFKFQISQHCTVCDKIMKNRQMRELRRASVHFIFTNGL